MMTNIYISAKWVIYFSQIRNTMLTRDSTAPPEMVGMEIAQINLDKLE